MDSQRLTKAALEVHVAPDAFVKRRLVSGPIWLEMAGESFPSEGWIDFPVAILGFWLSNLNPVILAQSRTCECPFMDGPYELEIEVRDDQLWTVSFLDRDKPRNDPFLSALVDFRSLITNVLSSADIVVEVCRAKRWIDPDLLELEAKVDDIRKLLLS
jgi:hypothetical protein